MIFLTPQNLVEFWNVATRPVAANGLGQSPIRVEGEIRRLEGLFPLLPDDPGIYREWQRLVVSNAVVGRQVHDARLAAVVRVYGLSHLLTFNTADFLRYPGITPVGPASLAPTP